MGGLVIFLGDWGHVLCAGLFAALTIWTGRRFATHRAGKLLVAALSLTAIWSLSIAFGGVDRLESGVTESLRNCAWLVCLFMLPLYFDRGSRDHVRGALPLYATLVLLLVAQCVLDIFAAVVAPGGSSLLSNVAEAAVVLRMLWAIGALILIQRMFIATAPYARRMAAPVAAAMAAMWSYDLLLYAAAFLNAKGAAIILFSLRGVAMALLAPVIGLGLRSGAGQVISPSRLLAWRGLGTGAALCVMMLMLFGLFAIEGIDSPVARAVATGAIFALVVGTLLILPSTRLHAHMKVLIAKHLFRHRYDYREQWMAFVDTIGSKNAIGGDDDAVQHGTIYTRAVKAMADITQSPSAALLVPDASGRLTWHSGWNWRDEAPSAPWLPYDLTRRMLRHEWIVDVAQERAAGLLPDWVNQCDDAWALVPILHYDALLGVMMLARPPVMRPLDWGDFDMLRTAGRQVASYIAEAQGQQALADARRFDEFNRRFAFIMHDIKNLVSQIALVARNAERHSDKPEFRHDMVLTLKECADKMNMLLARLAQHKSNGDAVPSLFALGDVTRAVVAAKGKAHPLLVEGDLSVSVQLDRTRLEQIVGHLVQNAIDASAIDAPVLMRVGREADKAHIAIVDHGCGMSAEFIRDELFRPFASTKQGGFGIGACEARELAASMGGALTVESEPGKGSIFTLALPLAEHSDPASTGKDSGKERAA